MTVRFITGRSGSGKTQFCIDSICAELAKSGSSKRILFLAPEQATFQIEQAVLEDSRISGYNRLEVTSFIRMAKKATREMPVNNLKALSKTSRQLLLYKILTECKDDLQVFGREITPGFCEQIGQILSELYRYDKSPSDLLNQYDKLQENSDSSNQILAAKLHDLAVIQKNWEQKVHNKYLDPDKYLDYLAEYFQHTEIAADEIWIDGFAGFTPQQFKVLLILFQQIESCNIALNLDHSSQEFLELTKQDILPDATNVFSPTMDTYQRLMNIIRENAIKLAEPVQLPIESEIMPRFSKSTVLGHVEKYVFAETAEQLPDGCTDGLEILQAPNQREELNAAAQKIIELCRERNYSFGDIAVIFREIENDELVRSVFEEYRIPYFMDAGKDTSHHPLIELIHSVFEMLTDNYKIDAIYNYLKNDLCPLNRLEADALENYCITTGVYGSQFNDKDPWKTATKEFPEKPSEFCLYTLSDIERFRHDAIAPVRQMKVAIQKAGDTTDVKTITKELFRLFEKLNVSQKLSEWQSAASKEDKLEESEIHTQLYSNLIDLFDELVGALEDFPLSLKEYSGILQAALKDMTLHLAPPALDQVLVGTIERSRQPNIKAAFILGVNDGIFPKFSSSTAIITDSQRELLQQNNFELAPAANRKLLDERYLGYIAFTRSSEYLWISYFANDNNDKAMNPSPFIAELLKISGQHKVEIIEDSRKSASFKRVTNTEQLVREFAAAIAQGRINGSIEELWSSFYQKHKALLIPEIVRRSIFSSNDTELTAGQAAELHGANLHSTSISRLEEFSRCPFKYFSNYMLKLNKREQFALQAMDLGSFYHAVLCEMFNDLQSRNSNWQELELTALPELVEKCSEKVIAENPEIKNLLEKNHRNNYIFTRAKKDLTKTAGSIVQAAKKSSFRQVKAEFEFGMDKNGVKGLELQIANDMKMVLKGVIDRVDISDKNAIAIYDYKLSKRTFNWLKFYFGLELQLSGYLQIAIEHFGKDKYSPAGMFYMATRPDTKSNKTTNIPDEVLDNAEIVPEAQYENITKACGIMAKDQIADLEVDLDGPSKFLSGIRLLKSGAINSNNALEGGDELNQILRYSNAKLTEIAREIAEGRIDVMPYRLKKETPCSNCPYGSVCRFDPAINSYREIPALDTGDIKGKITDKAV